ncbi:MAG: histidine phosphatase family protein [Dethiosulfovibrio sp.]|nr:histidine phosphatase family protein [Dethiosulfovibrio sp.]
MTRLFLVRHGMPALPGEKTFYGSTDLPLSQKGREQAEALRPLWESIKPQRVYSSPLSRSIDTARLSGLEPETMEDISEIDMGSWEMVPFSVISKAHPQDFRDRWQDIETFRPPGGESFRDVAERAQRAFRIMTEDSEDTAVAFGHIGVFRAILWRELGIPLKATFSLNQDHCGIHVLQVQSNRISLERANWAPIQMWGDTEKNG